MLQLSPVVSCQYSILFIEVVSAFHFDPDVRCYSTCIYNGQTVWVKLEVIGKLWNTMLTSRLLGYNCSRLAHGPS